MRGNAERRLPCTRYSTTNLNDLIVVASLLLVLPLVKRVPIECIVVRVREAVRTLLSHALLRAEGEYIRAPPPITVVRTAAVNDKLIVDRYVASLNFRINDVLFLIVDVSKERMARLLVAATCRGETYRRVASQPA